MLGAKLFLPHLVTFIFFSFSNVFEISLEYLVMLNLHPAKRSLLSGGGDGGSAECRPKPTFVEFLLLKIQ